MSWLAIFSLLDKVVPGRDERIRNKIERLTKEKDALPGKNFTLRAADKYDRLSREIRKLEKKLQNR